jgi:hypothetical protein
MRTPQFKLDMRSMIMVMFGRRLLRRNLAKNGRLILKNLILKRGKRL